MMTHNRLALSALLLVAATAVAGAQANPARPAPQQRPLAGAQRRDSQALNRVALEANVRNRIAQMARRQLGLTEAQVEKLQQTNARFADRRRTLMEQERDIRMSLRDELIAGDSSRQRQVADLLDRMVKAQRQRIDLLEQEQKDLAAFLTPMQRARYFGMEEQIRQRLQQVRQDGGGPMGPGGRGAQGRAPGRMGPGGPPNPDDMPMGGQPGAGMRRGAGGMPGAGLGPPAGQVRPRRPGDPPIRPLEPPVDR